MQRRRAIVLQALLALGVLCSARAAEPTPVDPDFPIIQPSGITVRVTPVITAPATDTERPLARINYAQALQDGRTFLNDTRGLISVAGPSGGQAAPYLDLRSFGMTPANNVAGFSGLAFSPNFGRDPAKPGYNTFYTATDLGAIPIDPTIPTLGPPQDDTVEIREWTATSPGGATFAGTSRPVVRIAGYQTNHSSGMIAFNPTAQPGDPDYGNLYIASGDGGYNDSLGNAQRLDRPQGKVLRIDPAAAPGGASYTVPADNPFLADAGALPEVWATGLRFPQSFSWDPANGTMYINDIGQAAIEEVDVGKAGANYGWGQRAGTYATGFAFGHDATDEAVYLPLESAGSLGFTDPIAEYRHYEGAAIGSGFLYRGAGIPALYGKYLLADIVVGRVFLFDPTTVSPGTQAVLSELAFTLDGQPLQFSGTDAFVTGYRTDSRLSLDKDGELLLALKSTGQVFALQAEIEVPSPGATGLAAAACLACLNRRRRAANTRA